MSVFIRAFVGLILLSNGSIAKSEDTDAPEKLVGVWEREIPRTKVTESWLLSRDLAGDFTIRVRFISNDREVASYINTESKWDDRTKTLLSNLKLASSTTGEWHKTFGAKARIRRNQFNYTSNIRSRILGGNLKKVEKPETQLFGEWVAQEKNHNYTEIWTVSKNAAGEWDIQIKYLDGKNAVGLAHGESFELVGDRLSFNTIMDKTPARNWSNNRAIIRPTGNKLLQTWTAGKHKGKTTLAKILKK